MIEIICQGGWVTSINDGKSYYISPQKVASLHGITESYIPLEENEMKTLMGLFRVYYPSYTGHYGRDYYKLIEINFNGEIVEYEREKTSNN